jgi:hypothetical protein
VAPVGTFVAPDSHTQQGYRRQFRRVVWQEIAELPLSKVTVVNCGRLSIMPAELQQTLVFSAERHVFWDAPICAEFDRQALFVKGISGI